MRHAVERGHVAQRPPISRPAFEASPNLEFTVRVSMFGKVCLRHRLRFRRASARHNNSDQAMHTVKHLGASWCRVQSNGQAMPDLRTCHPMSAELWTLPSKTIASTLLEQDLDPARIVNTLKPWQNVRSMWYTKSTNKLVLGRKYLSPRFGFAGAFPILRAFTMRESEL
jgi:hypothetical protein